MFKIRKKITIKLIKLTEETALNNIKEKCLKKDITFLSFCNEKGEKCDWKGSHNTYLLLRCNVCNFEWNTYTYHSFISTTRGCKKCAKNLKYTTETWVERCIAKYGNKFDYSDVDYVNNITKVHIKCNICGKDYYQFPSNHIKYGCRYCGRKESDKKRSLGYTTFVEKARQIHGDDYEYIDCDYVNNVKKLFIKCRKCGNIFQQNPMKHLIGHGCPKCSASRLEKEIRLFLEENNIKFNEQQKFDWLGKLSLDFYLPQYNIAIECQGEQHFKGWFGDVNSLKSINNRDKNKNNLCKENGIKLLYYSNLGINYPYKVFEDKNELLKEILT